MPVPGEGVLDLTEGVMNLLGARSGHVDGVEEGLNGVVEVHEGFVQAAGVLLRELRRGDQAHRALAHVARAVRDRRLGRRGLRK